jgi:pyrroloquinoline quinone biosynthesis protein B
MAGSESPAVFFGNFNLKAIVLGSAAGGGYPQWNCCCSVCSLFWRGDKRVRRRTQSSLAISCDERNWVLLNCSPDIREQISATKELHPSQGLRHSPIVSIVLTNGDIDHIGGLLSLREQHSFTVWAAADVLGQIHSNGVFGVLDPGKVSFREIHPRTSFTPVPGLEVEAFEVPGKVPLYRETGEKPVVDRGGNTMGLHLRTDSRTMSYVPGCGDIDSQLLVDLSKTDVLLFDGTVWTDDEMMQSGVGQKTGRRMGHVPVSSEDGSIKRLAALHATRRLFVHLNNTNPLLIDGSLQRLEAEGHGWQVAHDGLEITL